MGSNLENTLSDQIDPRRSTVAGTRKNPRAPRRTLAADAPRDQGPDPVDDQIPVRRFRLWCVLTDPFSVQTFANRERAIEFADRRLRLGRKMRDMLRQDGFVDCIPAQHGVELCRILGPIACEARWEPCTCSGFDGVWLAWDQALLVRHVIGFPLSAADEDLALEFARRLNKESQHARQGQGQAAETGASAAPAHPKPQRSRSLMACEAPPCVLDPHPSVNTPDLRPPCGKANRGTHALFPKTAPTLWRAAPRQAA